MSVSRLSAWLPRSWVLAVFPASDDAAADAIRLLLAEGFIRAGPGLRFLCVFSCAADEGRLRPWVSERLRRLGVPHVWSPALDPID